MFSYVWKTRTASNLIFQIERKIGGFVLFAISHKQEDLSEFEKSSADRFLLWSLGICPSVMPESYCWSSAKSRRWADYNARLNSNYSDVCDWLVLSHSWLSHLRVNGNIVCVQRSAIQMHSREALMQPKSQEMVTSLKGRLIGCFLVLWIFYWFHGNIYIFCKKH